jgi:hypothetical protein
MVTGCRLAFGVLSSGAGVLLNPGARTTPRVVVYHGQSVLAIYRATYDGYQGFIPVNASYTGNGNFSFSGTPFPPGYYRDHGRVPDTDFSVLNQTGNNEQFLASSPQNTGGTVSVENLRGNVESLLATRIHIKNSHAARPSSNSLIRQRRCFRNGKGRTARRS